jgi:hypothetical protein
MKQPHGYQSPTRIRNVAVCNFLYKLEVGKCVLVMLYKKPTSKTRVSLVWGTSYQAGTFCSGQQHQPIELMQHSHLNQPYSSKEFSTAENSPLLEDGEEFGAM